MDKPENPAKSVSSHKGGWKGGPWPKGVSGNPGGRKTGERPKASVAAEALLEGEVEGLTRRCIEAAMTGDMVAMKLCLERILPIRKRNPTPIALPAVDGLPGVVAALGEIVSHVAEGRLDMGAGGALASLVDAKRRALETLELEGRIAALEARGGNDGT